MITDQVRQDAAAAAEIIRERGLAKFKLEDDEGRVCLVYAIVLATNEPRKRALQIAVRAELGVDDPTGLVHWNNQPERTQDDVIDLLERVAAS